MSIHTSAMSENLLNPEAIADAERWYARLKSGNCAAAERMEFQRWRADPEHADAYAATERLWHSVGRLAARPDLEALSQRILAETAQRPERPGRRAVIAASMAIALFGGGIFLMLQGRGPEPAHYATAPGERSTVRLADGSQLVLNSASEIEVVLGKRTRRLTLLKGEALFTAAHDETRPFKVVAGDGEVTALGTRFQVRHETGQVTVTLLEGRVSVDRREEQEHALLHPGDQLRFRVATPSMLRRTVDPEIVASWSTGRLRFRSTPLAEALDEVNRYSRTQIRLGDTTLGRIPVSGTFEIGDSLSVVSALEALLPIRATQQSEAEILLRRH